MKPLVISLFLLMIFAFAVHAQETDCPAFLEAAIAHVSELCAATGRNQACYGNLQVVAEPQPQVTAFTFQQPGDTASVTDIHRLDLSGLDAADQSWGIALMRLQANLPDTLPGQNVAVLLFGDVGFRTDDEQPLQAFYLQSGLGDAPCAALPASGVLLQTPEGAAQVEVLVNGVHIALGSTAYLQAQDTLDIYLLEGQAEVTSFDVSRSVPAGSFVSVPLDNSGQAVGEPSEPQPFSAELPAQFTDISQLLPQPLTLASCTLTAGATVNVRSGPGRAYDAVEQLQSGQSTAAQGQAVGIDGLTWWMLANGRWVREDVVDAAGDCTGLPVVTDIPPLPTAVPTPVNGASGSGEVVVFNLNGASACIPQPPVYRVGTRYLINFGRGATTPEEADAAVAAGTSTITINGALASATRFVWGCTAEGVRDGFCQPDTIGYLTQAYWVPTEPGTYTIVGTGNHMINGSVNPYVDTCMITIEG